MEHTLKPGLYLILLVGIPASGKSTFCRQFKQVLADQADHIDCHHLEFDQFEDNLTEGLSFDALSWKQARQMAFDQVQERQNQLVSCVLYFIGYWTSYCTPP